MLRLYCIWRIGGEFNLSDLDPVHASKSTDELIKLCIEADPVEMDDDEIAELIEAATNPKSPNFMGYEMPAIFLSTDVEFIQK